MYRILFVDDEPRILTGLRRMLWSQRRDWAMEFAGSATEALGILRSGPFDVVVSDARMPIIEGADLLREVRGVYPDTVRMILSGQCSRDSVLRCIGVAHQFLSKPCDAEYLKSAIHEVCRQRDRMDDVLTRTAVSSVASLPSSAEAYAALVDLIDSESSLSDISEAIALDVGMSLKVVQLVSNGFFGSPQPIVEIPSAVNRLGFDTLRALVAARGTFRAYDANEIEEEQLRSINAHSHAVADAARRIAATVTEDRGTRIQAYLGGLFHEIGALLGRAEVKTTRLPADTTALAGRYAAQAGGYLASLWGLPAEVAKAISMHQTPALAGDDQFSPLTAVHVANALCTEGTCRLGMDSGDLDVAYLRTVDCHDKIDPWRELCQAV